MYKAAIVGAGPAGLLCGTELKRLGDEVIVLEKDNKVGEPIECAGLFNIDGLRRLDIDDGDYILNRVKGARFISTSGKMSELKGDSNKAVVVDRGEFDRFLAKNYSGELALGTGVKSVKKEGKSYSLKTSGNDLDAESVVLATGYATSLHKDLGFDKPSEYISTSQYGIEGMVVDKDFVELYVGSVAPGFFGWVIPTGDKSARVGLGVLGATNSTHQHMKQFLERLKKDGKFDEGNKIVHKSGGLIPLYDSELSVSNGSAYLVGDAAGQVKATTGGGVMIGGLCAKELARSIHFGSSYESGIAAYDKELKNHLLIRKVINKFGDEQYEHMVDFLNKPEIKSVIEKNADMDFVGPLMGIVMKNPMLMMQAAKFMGKGIFF